MLKHAVPVVSCGSRLFAASCGSSPDQGSQSPRSPLALDLRRSRRSLGLIAVSLSRRANRPARRRRRESEGAAKLGTDAELRRALGLTAGTATAATLLGVLGGTPLAYPAGAMAVPRARASSPRCSTCRCSFRIRSLASRCCSCSAAIARLAGAALAFGHARRRVRRPESSARCCSSRRRST